MNPELKEKLIALFHEHPDLFEEIDPDDYVDEDGAVDSEVMLMDGEAALIEIELHTYRFVLDEVAEHVGDEVYD